MALLFSKNVKKNMVCNQIMLQLTQMGMKEVRHYMESFPKEIDYNIVQYGNVLVYYDDIRKLFQECGYKTKYYKNEQLWKYYKLLTRETVQVLKKIGLV